MKTKFTLENPKHKILKLNVLFKGNKIFLCVGIILLLSFTTLNVSAQVNVDAELYYNFYPLVISKPTASPATISVIVKNNGVQTLQTAILKYSYMNGPIVSTNWIGNLATGDTSTFIFITPINVVQGKNVLKVWIEKPGDTIHTNDTNYFDVFGYALKNLPYSDNFDGNSSDFLASGTQNLWERGIPSDTFLNSAHSGQNAWVTNLDGDYPNNAYEYLYTPFYNLQGVWGATLSFWHKYKVSYTGNSNNNIGDFIRIEYTQNGWSWSSLGYMSDPEGTNWYNSNFSGLHAWSGNSGGWIQSTYNLNWLNYSGSPTQFRFVFRSNASFTDEGWAIDDFEISTSGLSNGIDGAIVQYGTYDTISNNNPSHNVSIEIRNTGNTSIDTVDVYFINGDSSIVHENSYGIIMPGSSTIFTFNTHLTHPLYCSQFNFKCWIHVNGDINSLNDTIFKTIYFNTLNAEIDAIISPLDSINFGNNEQVIFKIKNVGTKLIHQFNICYNVDSIYYGVSFQSWNDTILPGATLTDTFTNPFLTSQSWANFKISVWISGLNNIQSMNLGLPKPSKSKKVIKKPIVPLNDIGISNLILTGFKGDTITIGQVYKLKASIKNFGLDTIHSFGIQYNVNSSIPKIEIWTGTLNPGSTYDYIFNDSIMCNSGKYNICAKALLQNDTTLLNDEYCKEIIAIVGFEDIWQTSFTLLQNTPNPAGGNTQIDFEIPISGKVKFQLTNMLGQMLESQEKEFSSGRNSINLDVSKLPAGIYYYSIEMEGRRLVKKMVVD